MSRYLLFGYSHYYPSGGMKDMIIQFNTIDEVVEYFKVATDYDIGIDWNDEYQLVNTMDNLSYKVYKNDMHHSDLDEVDILQVSQVLRNKLIDWIEVNL